MNIIQNIKEINNQINSTKEILKKINPKCVCNRGVIVELNNIKPKEEDIIYFVGGKCEQNYYNVFVTNKRILFITSATFSSAQIQIPLEKISSISRVKGIMTSKIKIWDGTIAGVEISGVPNDSANTFVNVVNEQLNNYKSFKIEVNKTVEKDITDKIEKLSDLYKSGILTEYEFNIKKMELLEKLKK